jgi:putative ABC transport system permease protein
MLLLTLALRDLRGGLKRMRVFIACLAMGVAIMATIGSITAAVKAGIEKDSRKLLGGDVEISQVHMPLANEILEPIQKQNRVSASIEMRTMASSAAGRILVEMRGVDVTYPMIGDVELNPSMPLPKLFAQEGGVYGAAVEENILHLLNLSVGDSIKIGNTAFKVRAVLVREPDRVINAFTLGPRVLVSEEAFKATGLAVTGALLNYRYDIILPQGIDNVAWMASLHKAHPSHGFRLRGHQEASPGLRNAVDRLNLFLSLCGITALITAGIGIANAVRSYLFDKQRTIAILKCIGGNEKQVFDIYLIQISCISMVAISIGLIMGISLQALLLSAAQELLPVPSEASIYPLPLGLSALMGFFTTIAFSILPLAQETTIRPSSLLRGIAGAASRVRIHWIQYILVAICLLGLWTLAVVFTGNIKITTAFAMGTLASLLVFMAVARLVQCMARKLSHSQRPMLRLALANLYRPGATTPSIVVALGIGMSLLVALALIGTNLRHQISEGLPKDSPAFFMIDIQPDQLEPLKSELLSISGVTSFDSLPMIRGRITRLKGTAVEELAIPEAAQWAVRGDRGITYAREIPPKTSVVEGAWWNADYVGEPLISFDAKLAKEMGLAIGDTLSVSIMGQEITGRIANLREIDWTTLRMNFTIIFSPDALKNMPVTHLATVVATPESEPVILSRMGVDFSNVSAIRMRDSVKEIVTMLTHISYVVLITASLSVILGVLVMAAAISATLNQRIYDTVVLKVLGIERKTILTVYGLEFSLIAFIVAGLAILVGTGAAWGVMQLMIFSKFIIFPSIVASVLIGCLAIAITLGLIASIRALAVKPLSILRNE